MIHFHVGISVNVFSHISMFFLVLGMTSDYLKFFFIVSWTFRVLMLGDSWLFKSSVLVGSYSI